MFWLLGKKAPYPALSWWENFMGGHISWRNITIFGANTMCWTLKIHTKKYGYIVITLPSIARYRRKWGFHIYCSPNGTQWASTFYLGKDKDVKILSQIRKKVFGHNFCTDTYYERLSEINSNYENL